MGDNIEKLFKNLESNDVNESNEAKSELVGFFQKTKEPWLVNGLMDYYTRNPRSSRIIEVLVKAHNPHETIIFDKLSDWLKIPQNRLTALNIFAQIIHKQPSWLNSVYKHKFFKDLLKLLQHDTEVVFLMNGLLCIITLLPIIPSLVPNFLNDLFEIFNSIALIKFTNSNSLTKELSMHLNLGLKMFFDLLYGMYPCNFFVYLKECYKKDNIHIAQIIKPLLESVRIHPLLVLSDKENELNKTRWNKKEPHDVVSECDNLSITYLTYSADFKDCTMDLSNELLSIETPIPENMKSIRKNILSPTSRLLTPNIADSHIWSPLNAMSQKSPLVTSGPSTAQNTPLSVPYTPIMFHGSSVKNTPNNQMVSQMVISGTSPPEAAVEATPESTPLKEVDIFNQNCSFPHGHSNTLAVRAILNKTGEDSLSKSSQLSKTTNRLSEMLSHRNESQKHLGSLDMNQYDQHVPVFPGRNRFLSERNDCKWDFSDYLDDKEPNVPKIIENVVSSTKSCPDINQLLVATHTNKTESIFIYSTKSTQTSDCSLSKKLIDLIEENNMLKRKQLIQTPCEANQANTQDVLNEYIEKMSKIDMPKQHSSKNINDMKDMKEQLQLLYVQLQYEKYRRDVHAERNRRLMGRSRDKRTLELENAKLREQLLQLQNTNSIDLCRSHNKQQDLKLLSENTQLKQKLKEQSDKLRQKELDNLELQEKLNIEMKRKREDKEKIDQLNGDIFGLRHDLDEAQYQISLGKKYKDDLARLESELILMGEIQIKCKEKLGELESIRARDEEFKLLERSYINEVKELKTCLEDKKANLERAKHKNNDLQNQNNNKEQAFTDQKRNLKTVKDSYEERLKALSNKYEVQKTIILQMEQAMFEMNKNTSNKNAVLSPESDKIDFASSVEKSSPLSASLASSEGLSVTAADFQSLVESASSRSTLQTSPLKSTVPKILPSTSSNNSNKG